MIKIKTHIKRIFSNYKTNIRVDVFNNNTTVTVNGRKIDLKSKEGQRLLKNSKVIMKDMESGVRSFEKTMDTMNKHMDSIFK